MDTLQYAAACLTFGPAWSLCRVQFKRLAVVTAAQQLIRKNDPTLSAVQPGEEWERS